MPRRFFRKFRLKRDHLKNQWWVVPFNHLLHDPNLWHLNRRSVAGAFAVGLFCMWMPIPFQMVLAAGVAIWLRTNLPISVVLVWITNPVTVPPMFYFAYLVGTWIVGAPVSDFTFELSFDWLLNELSGIWKPFLVGCFTVAISCSLLGYFTIQGLWRYSVLSRRSTKLKFRK